MKANSLAHCFTFLLSGGVPISKKKKTSPQGQPCHSQWKLFLILALVSLCLLPPQVLCADTENTVIEVPMGMSTALSGPTADLGINMLDGIRTAFARANSGKGVKRKYHITLKVLDDGYEPARTAPNMRQLIEEDLVLGIIGNMGTPTATVAIPIANENRTLFFAPFSGGGVLRKIPPDRYVINYRPSYANETATMVKVLIEQAGLQVDEIAFFSQRDAYGDAGYIGGLEALKEYGLKDESMVLHVRYERNSLAVDNALAGILLAEQNLRAIIMVGTYGPTAKFIQQARDIGIDSLFLNVSVGSESIARLLTPDISGVVITQVVPHPVKDIALPIVREYQADQLTFFPQNNLTFGGLEGYIAGRIFTLALESIPGAPNRENIVDALEQLGTFDIGLGTPLTLSSNDHQASQQLWPTLLQDGHFVPFKWGEVQTLIPGKSSL